MIFLRITALHSFQIMATFTKLNKQTIFFKPKQSLTWPTTTQEMVITITFLSGSLKSQTQAKKMFNNLSSVAV